MENYLKENTALAHMHTHAQPYIGGCAVRAVRALSHTFAQIAHVQLVQTCAVALRPNSSSKTSTHVYLRKASFPPRAVCIRRPLIALTCASRPMGLLLAKCNRWARRLCTSMAVAPILNRNVAITIFTNDDNALIL
jgi:hypothetical protein